MPPMVIAALQFPIMRKIPPYVDGTMHRPFAFCNVWTEAEDMAEDRPQKQYHKYCDKSKYKLEDCLVGLGDNSSQELAQSARTRRRSFRGC